MNAETKVPKPMKLVAIGNSTGVIIPKEMLARMKLDRGDSLYLTEAPEGGYRLSPYDPEFERAMRAAEDIMQEDRDILHVLAR